MFAPGMPRTTPGTVLVRLTKLRPLSGSVLICSSWTVVPSSDVATCTSGEAAATVTVSATVPTSSRAFTRTFVSTVSSMSESVAVLNPGSSATILYLPVGSEGAVYSPAWSVTMVRVRPVPWFVSVTVAPGTAAPDVSVTVPRIVPVTAWAARPTGRRHSATTRPNTTLFTFFLHAPAERRGTIPWLPCRRRLRDRSKSLAPWPPPPRPRRCLRDRAAADRSAPRCSPGRQRRRDGSGSARPDTAPLFPAPHRQSRNRVRG